MSIIDINKYKEKLTLKLTLKRKIILITSFILIASIAILIMLYLKNNAFRDWADNYVFKKNIENSDILSIEIDMNNNPSIYAYDKYITVFEKNNLKLYNANGNIADELEISLNNPIYNSDGKYLCMAENSGNSIYLVSNGNIVWQGSVEGTIKNIRVNKNGYVSVIETGTSYKTIVILFDPNGKEVFKTYLSSSNAIAADISEDNDKLAIAEIDTSGAIIKSNIKIISVDKAKNDPTNSVEYSIPGNNGDVILDIKYQDKKKLVCFYDTGIHIIENGQDNTSLNFNKEIFTYIKNKNHYIYTTEQINGLFSRSTTLTIKNVQNDNETKYQVDSTIKSIKVYDSNIVMNLGTEAQFINTSGWLQKKYKSKQEISNIVLGSSIAGVIYRDRIEIIDL